MRTETEKPKRLLYCRLSLSQSQKEVYLYNNNNNQCFDQSKWITLMIPADNLSSLVGPSLEERSWVEYEQLPFIHNHRFREGKAMMDVCDSDSLGGIQLSYPLPVETLHKGFCLRIRASPTLLPLHDHCTAPYWFMDGRTPRIACWGWGESHLASWYAYTDGVFNITSCWIPLTDLITHYNLDSWYAALNLCDSKWLVLYILVLGADEDYPLNLHLCMSMSW